MILSALGTALPKLFNIFIVTWKYSSTSYMAGKICWKAGSIYSIIYHDWHSLVIGLGISSEASTKIELLKQPKVEEEF